MGRSPIQRLLQIS